MCNQEDSYNSRRNERRGNNWNEQANELHRVRNVISNILQENSSGGTSSSTTLNIRRNRQRNIFNLHHDEDSAASSSSDSEGSDASMMQVEEELRVRGGINASRHRNYNSIASIVDQSLTLCNAGNGVEVDDDYEDQEEPQLDVNPPQWEPQRPLLHQLFIEETLADDERLNKEVDELFPELASFNNNNPRCRSSHIIRDDE